MRAATWSSWWMRSRSFGFSLLLADELRHLHGRGHLRGEAAKKSAIVGRIGLIGEPGAEIEGAEKLPLADQRHDELHTSFSEGVHRLRLQFEVAQHDWPARGQEKRFQWIPNRDRNGLDQPGLRLRDLCFVPNRCLFFGSAPSHQLNHGPISISPSSRNRYEPTPRSMSGASSPIPRRPTHPRPFPGRRPAAMTPRNPP